MHSYWSGINVMTEEMSAKILDAAEVRFRSYGYGKTTMAEIAGDLDMSTANLYRYYENKLAIGSAMAGRCFCQRKEVLKEVVDREDLTSSECLEVFILEMLNLMHGQFNDEPKLAELVNVMIEKRPDLIQGKIQSDMNLIQQILQKGNDGGEFNVNDVEEAAAYVFSATVQFSSPFFMRMFPLEELQRLAKGVVALLLNGLVKK